MRQLVIEFYKPMDISESIYTPDRLKYINNHKYKLYALDLREESYHSSDERIKEKKLPIGSCNLIKDDIGIWVEIQSSINTSPYKIYPAVIGKRDNNNIIDGSIEWFYISIEQNPKQWIREYKLNTIIDD